MRWVVEVERKRGREGWDGMGWGKREI